jgi:electron transfer flavoprotein beta subunit
MIAACLKWVDRRPEVDPLTGAVRTDARTSGPSDADEAALEWALRMSEKWAGEVIAIAAGPASVEPMLRDALAAGATNAVRVDIDLASPSNVVATAMAEALRGRADVIVCGAWSLDRGTGSVPAFLAAELDAAQSLGVIGLTIDGPSHAITADRRLDRGRRERVFVSPPAVISVEGGSARLRRAHLDAVLAAHDAEIEVQTPSAVRATAPAPVRTAPFRPRPRVLPAPPAGLDVRERILALSGALVDRDPPRVVRLDPSAAADELLEQLHAWGYR